jgi:putative DNA primase/helicase
MTETARELAARLGMKQAAGGWIGPCPACGYRTGLRLSEKAGRALWWCASCRDQAAVTSAILGAAAPAPVVGPSIQADDVADRKAAALRMWDSGLPWQGTPVAAYLALRLPGVALDGLADLRFLPQARHPGGARFPVMLALLRDAEGRPASIHRTFLAHGGAGKARVEPAKMTLGPVRGAAVRLHQAGPRLVIGEGIETTLAAALLLRAPAWAAVSAGNIRDTLTLPPAVREVVIAADHDAAGLDAATKAAARWRAEGRAVRIAKPQREGADFADLIAERARRG